MTVPLIRILAIDAASPLMPAVLALRREVFVVEQNVPPELEYDEFDAMATHLVALRDEAVIGTLRLLADGAEMKVGRVAVRADLRKTGIGTRLMQHVAQMAAARGAREIVLHAQTSVIGFYRRLGYREESEAFEEAGIPHLSMRRALP